MSQNSPKGSPILDAQQMASQIREAGFPKRSFDPGDFGAKGDGKSNDLPALQAAVDACNAQGGGRVSIEPRTYCLRGPLRLKSHVELHLPQGSRLKFSGIPKDFLPAVLTRWEGILNYGYSPFIYAYQATNVGLTGKGTVDGNSGETFGKWLEKQDADQQAIWNMGDQEPEVHKRQFGEGHWLRPSLVQFFGCERVLVEGPTFNDSPFWVVHPVFCRHVVIRDILVDSFRLNNDGIDPDSCSHVLIENSVFRTGDDAIAIKSGRDADGRRWGVPSEHIVVRNNNFAEVHNGVAIGSELSGSVRNVVVENCTVGEGRNLIYFKSNRDRGGTVENIQVRNVKVGSASISLVRFETNYFGYRGTPHPSTFRNFTIQDICCEKVDDVGIWAIGHDEAPLENILLRNISIEKAPISGVIRPGDEIILENISINGAPFTQDDALTELDQSQRRHTY